MQVGKYIYLPKGSISVILVEIKLVIEFYSHLTPFDPFKGLKQWLRFFTTTRGTVMCDMYLTPLMKYYERYQVSLQHKF